MLDRATGTVEIKSSILTHHDSVGHNSICSKTHNVLSNSEQNDGNGDLNHACNHNDISQTLQYALSAIYSKPSTSQKSQCFLSKHFGLNMRVMDENTGVQLKHTLTTCDRCFLCLQDTVQKGAALLTSGGETCSQKNQEEEEWEACDCAMLTVQS